MNSDTLSLHGQRRRRRLVPFGSRIRRVTAAEPSLRMGMWAWSFTVHTHLNEKRLIHAIALAMNGAVSNK